MKLNKKTIFTIFIIMILLFIAIVMQQQLSLSKYFDNEGNSISIGFYIIIFLIIIFIFSVLMLPYVIKKKPITEEKFKEKLEAKGYIVSDVTNEFSNYNYISKVYSAINKEFTIQFYILEDEKHANMFYENTELSVKQSPEKFISSTANKSKYTILSSTSYKVGSKISNTVICLQVPKDYIEIAKKTLKELGY